MRNKFIEVNLDFDDAVAFINISSIVYIDANDMDIVTIYLDGCHLLHVKDTYQSLKTKIQEALND